MKLNRKNSIINIVIILLLTLVVGAVFFLFLPSNYYVRTALIHQMPKIDQYKIFDNRVVKAESPQPWEFAVNIDKNQIPQEFDQDFKKYKTVAFIVIQNKKIILEEYWGNYGPLSLSNSFSMSKTLISLLIGCAINDGVIKNVDQPVSDFLPEWTAFDGKQLTIKHLLTMSAGVDWEESHSTLFSKTTEAYYGKDLWNLTLTARLIKKPGVEFYYQSGASQILAYLLQKATSKSISDYASEKIWTPIHAEVDALWSLDKQNGMEKAYCCFNSNARDFARLGQLVLNKGQWDGLQVVDSNYIRSATTPATWLTYTKKTQQDDTTLQETAPCTFYGYQFWIANYRGMKIPYMRGILGQYVFIIPQLNAVIVRLGKDRAKEYNVEQEYPNDVDVWIGAGLDVINKQK